MKRLFWLGFALYVYMICTGCGETFRPIIIPNPPVFPNPKAAHTVLSINDNGDFVPGSAMVIDVSGDTNVSTVNSDIHPIQAVQQSATQVLVVNRAVIGLNVPTSSCLVTAAGQTYDVCPSITKLNFNSTVISGTQTISLPPYSGSNFVAVAPSSPLAYVTMPTYPPDPTHPLTIVPTVGVINTQSNNLVETISVDSNPFALAVTPDNSKLYVANNSTPCTDPATPGICSISAFNTVDRSARTVSGTLSSAPIWLTPRSDSQRVYVLEANGTLGSIDTTSTAGPGVFSESTIGVPNATIMVYDSNLNRLYIPGGDEIAIVDVSQSTPVIMAGGPIMVPTASPTSRSSSDPCAETAEQQLKVVAATALPDGSRAYVGSYYEDLSDNICPQVTVIDVASNTIKGSPIAIPGFPAYDAFCGLAESSGGPRFRLMMAAAGDSSRAYLSSCDGGNVNIVNTTGDTYFLNLPAPLGSRPPIPPSQLNPPQNPVFLLAGP